MNRRPSVTIREFARLVGVTHPAVLQAIKSSRLSKSVVLDEGKKTIIVFDGWAVSRNSVESGLDSSLAYMLIFQFNVNCK